jgi:L-asparaginase
VGGGLLELGRHARALEAQGAGAAAAIIAASHNGRAAMEELLVVTTGGTIDKVYFDDKSDYQVGDPQIGGILRELGVAFRFTVIPIIRKDSLHITDADRELVRAAIVAQPAKHVLVTHGTDTMVETAKVLATIAGKTIVLTGALNPARFRGSDAEFNIGCAVGAVQSLPPGVYVAMNGRIWDPLKVRKNVAANRFESLD